MKHDFIDRYSRLDSTLHRLPAGFKLVVACGLVVITVLQPHNAYVWFAGLAVLLVAGAIVSRIPLAFLARRISCLEPLVIGISLLALFQPQGGRLFLGLVMKSSLCLWVMLLMSGVTPFSEILRVLRRIRVPFLLVTTLALMYRYLYVLLDETERMHRARASRTFTPSRRLHWQMLATMLGQLFIRTTERAERIYAAMCARGWK